MPPGVKFKELSFLMQYFYYGEVIIEENDVPELVKTAEILKVRGIAIPFDTDEDDEQLTPEEVEKSSCKKFKLGGDENNLVLMNGSSNFPVIKEEIDDSITPDINTGTSKISSMEFYPYDQNNDSQAQSSNASYKKVSFQGF